VENLGIRGWPLLLLVSLVSLGVAAQGSPRPAPGQGLRRVPPAELSANILAGLEKLPRPALALEQRFTVGAVPSIEVPLGPYRMQLKADLPAAGDGAVDVDLVDAGGEHQQLSVVVTRRLRAVLAHAAVALSPGTVLTAAHVAPDTTWVERSIVWQRARAVADRPVGWTVHRALEAGTLLCAGDLQRTDVTLRAQTAPIAQEDRR
jgi:hypothetical protein